MTRSVFRDFDVYMLNQKDPSVFTLVAGVSGAVKQQHSYTTDIAVPLQPCVLCFLSATNQSSD